MFSLLAQIMIRGWGIGEMAIAIVIIVAVVALVLIGCRAMGVEIPGWVVQVFWVIIIAMVIIAGIRFVMSL